MSDLDAREILIADGWSDTEADRFLADRIRLRQAIAADTDFEIAQSIARKERRKFARKPEPPTGFGFLPTTQAAPFEDSQR